MKSLLLVFSLFVASPAFSEPSLPLRVVGKAQFCNRLNQLFLGFAAANGYDQTQSAIMAFGATAKVVDEFRAGRASDFVSAMALGALVNQPNRFPADAYLPLSGFVGDALGIGQNIVLALSPAELRFIPTAQRGVDIVVIATNAATLTPERARKVAEVARNLAIHISVIWASPGADSPEIAEARSLAWIAAMTGGAFVSLAGAGNGCATSL